MTRETLRVCRDALYARLDAIDNDLRTNTDYYAKGADVLPMQRREG